MKDKAATVLEIALLVLFFALIFFNVHASATPPTWTVHACPTNSKLPCRVIVEKNRGQAVKEARYLNAHGWYATVR